MRRGVSNVSFKDNLHIYYLIHISCHKTFFHFNGAFFENKNKGNHSRLNYFAAWFRYNYTYKSTNKTFFIVAKIILLLNCVSSAERRRRNHSFLRSPG